MRTIPKESWDTDCSSDGQTDAALLRKCANKRDVAHFSCPPGVTQAARYAARRATRAIDGYAAGCALLLAIAGGCGGGANPATQDAGPIEAGPSDAGDQHCLEPPLSLDCTPAFDPSYQALYTNLLRKTCGAPETGVSCHGPDGAQDGLVLSDNAQGYDYLLGKVDGRARVVAGKPECSVLEQRLESNDPGFRMPAGMPQLPEDVRCAVRQWIAMGAKR